MRKIHNIVGLPVLEMKTGAELGEVQEVILNLHEAKLFGVILNDSVWFGQIKGILFSDFFAIGQDAITVSSGDVVQDLTLLLANGDYIRFCDVHDKQVYSEMGEYLGMIADICYDSSTGEIKSYELSDSVVNDFLYGRSRMPLPRAQIVNNEKMIVPETTAKLLHSANSKLGGA